MSGVVRTRAGYAGGLEDRPTYEDLKDHSETVEVVFDPAQISFEDLLDEFWKSHDPSSSGGSRQYRNVVLFDGEAQRKAAEASRMELARLRGIRVRTAVEPLSCFWPAEEYHQKYHLQAKKTLLAEFKKAWPAEGQWFLTRAASRVNAHATGDLDGDSLARELGTLALPDGFLDRLQPLLRASRKSNPAGSGR